MSQLSDVEREFVAIGAALGSNCIPCVEYHVRVARKVGIRDPQLAEAFALADKVRQTPAKKVLEAAHQLLGDVGSNAAAEAEGCPCGAA